jgi:hypothetical protein
MEDSSLTKEDFKAKGEEVQKVTLPVYMKIFEAENAAGPTGPASSAGPVVEELD